VIAKATAALIAKATAALIAKATTIASVRTRAATAFRSTRIEMRNRVFRRRGAGRSLGGQ
jgi:hypothetical protein